MYRMDSFEGVFVFPVIVDVQCMFFIGFGFLMTFMKRFGYTAVTLTLMVPLRSFGGGRPVFSSRVSL
jgi:hypothetical protein